MKKTLQSIFCLGFVLISHSLFSQHVVINEVYGGGGNSGSVYKNDFIELHNPTTSSVDLTGWSVQYASATGTGSWMVTALSGSIEPGGYYLIQEAAGTNGTTDLPTPDDSGSIALAATAGKVALVSSTTPLSGQCPSTNVVDVVGFGGAANCFEGLGKAPAPSNTSSVERKVVGVDTNDNSVDFQTSNPPNPRNKIVAFTAGYPKIQSVTVTDFEIVSNLNKTSTIYYVILLSGSSTPSSVQVKNGQDASGSVVASDLKGSVQVATPSSDVVLPVTGLTGATAYDVYVVAENIGGLQSVPVKLQVTTVDPSAPNLSLNTTSILFPGFTDKSKQSPAELYTITASNLSDDVLIIVSGNYLISKDDTNFSTSLSFSPGDFITDQIVYVRFNPSGNLGSQAGTITHSSAGILDKQISLSAIAIDPYHQNFNDPAFLTNSGWSQHSKAGAQIWASTNFGHTCLSGCNAGTNDKAIQINGFSGSAVMNEDWLISPKLDLGSYSHFAAMSFWTISAFEGDALQLKYSTDYSGIGDPTLATWTTLNGKFPSSNSNLWTESSNVLLPKQNNLYVAFIYTSTAISASRWTIDDWKVEDVESYLNVPNFNFSFGEVAVGNVSMSQSFVFDAQGFGDLTLTAPSGYELSVDDENFFPSLIVNQQNALNGETIFVRLAPLVKQLKWQGTINFIGTGLTTLEGALSGSSYPRSGTFDVTTYNLEFFGTDVHDTDGDEFGPADDALQIGNVISVMQTIQSDIFAVEEVSDDNAMDHLVTALPGYEKIMANRWSYSFEPPEPDFPPQKIGFIYKTSTVDLVDSRVMFVKLFDDIRAGQTTLSGYPGFSSSSFWSSGRLPFMATVDVTINNVVKRIKLIALHSKSGSAPADYDRRKYDVKVLYDSLMTHYPNDNIIILGDFNDDVDESISIGSPSTYKVFVDDPANFKVLTYGLSQSGGASFPGSGSFLDHIIISNELFDSYIDNSISVDDPRSYISNYSNTTSDHLPVSARFSLKGDQVITFELASPKTYSPEPLELMAASSSGLPVSYSSSNPSVASIEGNRLMIHKAGIVNITASQAGNVNYDAAANVPLDLVINKAIQTIDFAVASPKAYGDVPFELDAVSSSGLPINYSSSDPAVVSIEGNEATIHKAGRVNITASHSGDDRYTAAQVNTELIVTKLTQTITFTLDTTKTYGDAPFKLSASASSGLAVSYSSSNSAIVELDGNEATIHKTGTIKIIASQSGNEWYEEAESIVAELVINKAAQTIRFDPIEDKSMDENSFELFASSSSGLPVMFTSSSNKVLIDINQVGLSRPGRVTIMAIQNGNIFYEEASATQSFCIKPARPSITILNQASESETLISSSSIGNQWYRDNEMIELATNSNYVTNSSGIFKVQVMIDDCVSDFSDNVSVVVTGLSDVDQISFYPNPAIDNLILTGISSSSKAMVTDISGRSITLSTNRIDNDKLEIDVRFLNRGIYVLKITDDQNIRQIRFVKN